MSVAPKKPSLFQSMGLGGMSAMFAVNFTHPIETVKTRMQVTGNGLGQTVSGVFKNEGVSAFWKGIVFAYGRELSYTSIKLGAYAPVRDMLGAGGSDAPFYLKFLAGALTGGTGSFVGNPFDVMKTLAQTNTGSKPLAALVGDMFRDQGIAGFYRGVEANIARACVLNATKMGVYDVTKGMVVEKTGWKRKDIRTSFSAAFVAGFFMTCTVSPFDMIRTKLMNQPTDKKIYDGFADCFAKTIRNDGVLSLWRGFVPIWARFAPQATLQLLTIDFLYTQFGFTSI
ncbi:Kidney mitochondrial carrier protein 1 [Seminavis robusta]|uniref:Kidney mitochondrial carrier protein 1 n=1 Tax=Seminavis robusta TaxID=568900 RepID=A0A9N8E9Y1_9STRA|nr:Kidney mitochondrial carrier protein 1 [Seminavis robusta]|eukprot:Sro710_g191000.1 Kidney mitochondrial carrier protein 1 (284) ;mRNA; r:10685-11795